MNTREQVPGRQQLCACADYEIMLARTKASRRGATPAEIQRNVLRLAGDVEIVKEPSFAEQRAMGLHATPSISEMLGYA